MKTKKETSMNKKSLLVVALLSAVGVIVAMGTGNTGSACGTLTSAVKKSVSKLDEAEKKLVEAKANLVFLKKTKAPEPQIADAKQAVVIAEKEVNDQKAALERDRTVAGAHCQPKANLQ